MAWRHIGVVFSLICGASFVVQTQQGKGASTIEGATPPPSRIVIAPPLRLLERYAAEAKTQGKTEIERAVRYSDSNVLVPLDRALRRSSVVLVTPSQLDAGQTVLADTIVGWHIFRVLRTLKENPAPESSGKCAWERPKDVRPKADEIAVSLEGGAAQVAGVTVRLVRTDPDSHFKAGEEYLLLGSTCASGDFPLEGRSDVYHVLPNGKLTHEHSDSLTQQVMGLGSVDAMQQFIDKLK
jgi:hypothetical protein